MVRREFCYLITWITIARANKGETRITRTLNVISAPSRYCQLFTSYFFAEICSFLLISACLPISSWADGCQEPAALAVRSTLDRQMNMMYLCDLYADIIRHHTPYKTCQFSCYRRYSYVSCFAMSYEFIVTTS